LRRSDRPVMESLVTVLDSYSWMAQDHRVTLTIGECAPDLRAYLDWGVIERVLGNLISNGIKHSPEGSTVTLSACPDEGHLVLTVRDQGTGIAPEDQAHIFEKFTQAARRMGGTRYDTGLGLTFCKMAVEAHGGQITVESKLGAGATFILKLPMS
ncbi:MAG TPA: ATP-binding protein, partial [Aggregatilineales bacterium]|nr:ATP-binding protein [Aggregatilineales bacterium]